MKILRTKLFSEPKEKERKKKDKGKKINKDKALGYGIVAGGLAGNTVHGMMFYKDSKHKDENAKLSKKLLEDAKSKNVEVLDRYPVKELEIDKIKTGWKWLDKKDLAKKIEKKLQNRFDNMGPFYDSSNDRVITNNVDKAEALAHELGHRHYIKEKGSEKLGRTSHKAYLKLGGGLEHTVVSPMAGIVTGKAAGKNKARREERGEKESTLGKIAPIVTPIMAATPGLIAEAAASRRGIKMLKSHGASKEFIKESRKKLGHAFGTYASMSAVNAGVGEISKGRAYKKEKKKIEREKEKRENENTKK